MDLHTNDYCTQNAGSSLAEGDNMIGPQPHCYELLGSSDGNFFVTARANISKLFDFWAA